MNSVFSARKGDLSDLKSKRPIKKEKPLVDPPSGLFVKCEGCLTGHPHMVIAEHNYVCPKCGYHMKLDAYTRFRLLFDLDSFKEVCRKPQAVNPIGFPDYEKKLQSQVLKSKLNEAAIAAVGKIEGTKAVAVVMDCSFLMGSMGCVVGEKITHCVEYARKNSLPLVIFCASGGARMQEGIFSLMQMAKTSAALKRHHEAGQLFVSVLTDPTTGGVTASFAMLGDIILAEPNALIGFAGPRVIEQTIGQKLPEGFQRSEFLLQHGFIDKIVKREEMKETLASILQMHDRSKIKTSSEFLNGSGKDSKIVDIHSQELKSGGKNPWDMVLLSRKSDRPVAADYINAIFEDFMEFHGDRYFKDDGAIVGGIATFHGVPVTVIGQQKGKNTKDNIKCNFGMPSPEGYRKALRLMKQAETFGRPIICFVDTPGAFCGLEAEERGQGEAIARNLFEMSSLTVPVLSVVIGEGGSGGALAMAVANEVWMMENSIYSILSPEGFASILWKDSKKADEAAKVMKITARDLKSLNLIERIILEDEPVNQGNLGKVAEVMDGAMSEFLERYLSMSETEIAEHRYQRFRRM